MNQEYLNDEEEQISPTGNLVKWLTIIGVVIVVFGGSYWYYNSVILNGKIDQTPQPEVSIAEWKQQSENSIKNLINSWSAITQDTKSNGKLLNLLSRKAQEAIILQVDAQSKPLADLNSQLLKYFNLEETPTTYELLSSQLLTNQTVEVRTNITQGGYISNTTFILIKEDNYWVIDHGSSQKVAPVLPSPSPSSY